MGVTLPLADLPPREGLTAVGPGMTSVGPGMTSVGSGIASGGPGTTSGGPPGNEDEALGIVEAGEAIGIPTVTLLLQGIGMTLAQPRSVARETRRLAGDTLRILAGKS